jgi:hypothetical protein
MRWFFYIKMPTSFFKLHPLAYIIEKDKVGKKRKAQIMDFNNFFPIPILNSTPLFKHTFDLQIRQK